MTKVSDIAKLIEVKIKSLIEPDFIRDFVISYHSEPTSQQLVLIEKRLDAKLSEIVCSILLLQESLIDWEHSTTSIDERRRILSPILMTCEKLKTRLSDTKLETAFGKTVLKDLLKPGNLYYEGARELRKKINVFVDAYVKTVQRFQPPPSQDKKKKNRKKKKREKKSEPSLLELLVDSRKFDLVLERLEKDGWCTRNNGHYTWIPNDKVPDGEHSVVFTLAAFADVITGETHWKKFFKNPIKSGSMKGRLFGNFFLSNKKPSVEMFQKRHEASRSKHYQYFRFIHQFH